MPRSRSARRHRVPGARTLAGPFAAANGLSMAVALLVKDRDAGTSAQIALEAALR